MNRVAFNKKDGKKLEMTIDELSRWMCMVEAMDIIVKKSEDLNIKNVDEIIKPLAIEKYITERFPSMRHDIGVEVSRGLL